MGTVLRGQFGWQSHVIVTPRTAQEKADYLPQFESVAKLTNMEALPVSYALGILGHGG